MLVQRTERVIATAGEARLAQDVLSGMAIGSAFAVEQAGNLVTVPAAIGKMFEQVLQVLAKGGSVTISTMPDELTTSAAAEVLGISRPTLMKMIADGQIAAHMVGTHHRLNSSDVLAALRARRARERAALEALMELEGDDD